ncbi:MAG: hypothetical protein WBC33_06640 [Conexibacter sp.]
MIIPDPGDALLVVAVFTFIGAIIGGIVAVVQWIAGAAVTVAVTIAQAAVMIAIAIGHFAVAVGHVFMNFGGLLARFWTGVLRPFVTWTWTQLERLHRWLVDTFRPVIEFLEAVRRRVDAFYKDYIEPILDTIEVMRRTLQLLEALEIEWARKLDEKLAELEDRITAPFVEIRLYLNEAINRINSVTDGFGLFSRLALLRSMARDVGRIGALFHAYQTNPLTDNERRVAPGASGLKSPEQSFSESRAYLRTGDGPHAAMVDEWLAELRHRLASV